MDLLLVQLGYHIYPAALNELRNAVKSAASHTYSCAPAPVQYAVAEVSEYISPQHKSRQPGRIIS